MAYRSNESMLNVLSEILTFGNWNFIGHLDFERLLPKDKHSQDLVRETGRCSESRIKIFSVTILSEAKRLQIQLSEPRGRVLDLQWSRALELSKRDSEKRRAPSGLKSVDKGLGNSP